MEPYVIDQRARKEALARSPEENRRIQDEKIGMLCDKNLRKILLLTPDKFDWSLMRPYRLTKDQQEASRYTAQNESNAPGAEERLFEAAGVDGLEQARRMVTAWTKQEVWHGNIIWEYRIRAGLSTAQDAKNEVKRVRSKGFETGRGFTALQACIYGLIQEALTASYYKMLAKNAYTIMKDKIGAIWEQGCPLLADIYNKLYGQEMCHRQMYASVAKIIVENSSKDRSDEIIRTLAEFAMPGHKMVDPRLQEEAGKWAKKFGFPFWETFRSLIIPDIVEMIGSKNLGKAGIAYLTGHDVPLSLKSLAVVGSTLDKLPFSPGSRLVGGAAAKFI